MVSGSRHDRESIAFYERSFREEAMTAAQLDHPNIVPVYDIAADPDDQPVPAMKLVRGRPWDDIIRDEFPRTAPEDFLARHVAILVNVA